MNEIVLLPGATPLADWSAIYRGAAVRLPPQCMDAVRASAATIERIVAGGLPVYGINTGFGKLASVRIDAGDLATLQRNIVLSHSAGVGEPMPVPVTRLMMALKIASLAQGASGIRPQTLALLEAMLAADIIPLVPVQGSVGASGDLAPLAHMTAAMIGVGEAFVGGRRLPAAQALAEAGLAAVELGPKEGPGAAQRHAVFDRLCAGGVVRGRGAVPCGARHRRAGDRCGARLRHARSTTASTGCAGMRGQIESAAALRSLLDGSAIRASHRVGDERVQDPYCLRCQPQVMGACLDVLRKSADMLLTEANGVSDNPLVFSDYRRGACPAATSMRSRWRSLPT